MNPDERFVKYPDALSKAGLPPRLIALYGYLRLHAGKDGKCFAKHATLAEEIGLHGKYRDRQVRNLLNQLRQLRLIEWRRGRYSNHYVVLNPDRKWISDLTGNGFPISDRNCSSDRKESSSKEESKRGPSPTPPPSGAGAHRAKPSRNSDGAPGKTQGAKSKADDETPKPRPLTEAEFRERLKERHGSDFDVDRCLANIKRQLEKCSGLSLIDFLRYDAEHTTAPKAIYNPNGHYTALAKQLRHATVAAGLSAAFDPLRSAGAPPVPEPPRNDKGRCAPCKGLGKLPDGAYCTCAMGRDLEVLERHRPVQAEKKGPATAGQKEEKVNVINIKSRRGDGK